MTLLAVLAALLVLLVSLFRSALLSRLARPRRQHSSALPTDFAKMPMDDDLDTKSRVSRILYMYRHIHI